MFTISHGFFTSPGKIIINNSRANFKERISNLQIHTNPIHFHHTNNKKRFHNVNTVGGVHGSFGKGESLLKYIVNDSDNIDSVLTSIQDYIHSFKNAKFILSFSLDEDSDNEHEKDTELLRQEAITQLESFADSIQEGFTHSNTKLFTDEQVTQFMIAYYRDKPEKILEDFPEEHCENLRNTIITGIKELAENEAHEARPAINAQTHKSEIVILERSKAGRKLQDDDELQALYNEMELRFTTAEIKNRQGGITEIKTVMSLSYEQVKEWENYMPAFHRLKKFDIEILAHAATLYTAGNRIISTDMLFRQMNGGKTQQPTEAMRREIYDSFCRLGRTWLYIDASQEVKAGLNKKAEFRGALLPCSMIIGDTILNGQPAHDCIKIYDTSPLIEYARLKGQVSPIALDMFNIPNVNRTEENIMLIGYLTRAFADMRNEKSDRNKHIISYDSLYAYLCVEGSNQQVIRNKKAKIRKTVRAVLDTWCEGLHIKGYQELSAKDKPVRERVTAAKIRIEFFTAKEKKC